MFDESSKIRKAGRVLRATMPVTSPHDRLAGYHVRIGAAMRNHLPNYDLATSLVGCHPRRALLLLVLAALVILVTSVMRPGSLSAQTAATAPGNLQATVVAGGVQLSWSAPTENDRYVTGYQVLRRASGQSGMTAYVPDTGSTGTSYTDRGAAKQGETYTYQVRALSGGLTGEASNSVAVTIPGTCPISGGSPVDVPVAAVPIVVTSTVEDYFVLYVRHEKGGETIEYPVLVKRGEAGTTPLEDNLAPLPASRYKVKKYPVNNPADVDGDCIDDLTELADVGTKNPVNPAASVHISNGAVSIANRAAFRKLSYQGREVAQIDSHLRDLEYVKFIIMNPGSDRPAVYFMNTVTHRVHHEFADALGFYTTIDPWRNSMHGELVWHPNVAAPDGSRGVYRFDFRPWDDYAFDAVAFSFEALAASMPLLENNLAYYPVYESALPRYHREKALYDASRVNVLLEEGIAPDVDFIPLNEGEGYGLLREMELEERPNPRDIVIYETLPNDLPPVAGIITGVPQTPLSHVNLRAVQNGVPNAFIRAPLDDATIDDLLDRHVYYRVTQSGYTLRAATRAEVDAHYDASRPASAQTPERDLSVTKITPLSEIGFDDWDAFGVKAANMAVLGTLGFPEGTVRDGFAVPFYFYDEFMKNAGLAEETVFGKGKGAAEDRFTLPAGTKLSAVVTAILAHPKFRTDYEIQDEMLDDLRDAIKDARSPAWIITALEAMHAKFPEGTSLRYRSSTNNEDLPGYNGAGLYSSKTQDPDETAEDGIDKSIKGVWASLWNFRAFAERDFHRIDHTKTAMGVLVHPNYSQEKANGVAVSFDPVTNRAGAYYVNTQLGEDLITNPEAHSRPEEILLLPGGSQEVLVRSNLAEPGKLLMSAAQLTQLRSHLEVIHKKFSELYGAAEGEPFAMDIEFKITSLGKLSIKQARPWVFLAHLNRPPTVANAIADATIVNESGTREISLSGAFADDDRDLLAITAASSAESVATVAVSSDYSTLTVSAKSRGTATITVTAADGNGGSVEDRFAVRVKVAPVVASAIEDVTGLEVGSTQDISLSGVFSDADGDALTITAAASDRGVAAVSVAADYSGLTVSGVSEGAATITLTAQDSGTPKPTVNKPGAYEGYTLFYHPKDVKFYLIDNQGRKAFEWPGYVGLHGKLLDNGNLLSGHGYIGLAERNHRTIAVWFESSFSSHHDMLKLPNGNYLILHEVLYGKEAALAAGANPECLKKNGAIKVDEVVELTPRGEVAWRWRTWDHLIQDHDPDQRNYGEVADHPEKIDINYGLCRIDGTKMSQGRMTSLTHMNSLDYNADLNQIMVTVRHFSEIWIIDRSTTTAEASGSAAGNGGKGGDLLYRWGNPRAYHQGTKDDQKLFFPHNAHWIPAGLPGAGRVLLYNNGNEHPGFGRGYSSVDEITLPADGYGYTRPEGSAYGPSGPTWSYRHSDGSLAYWGSGARRLPNGNTLVVDAPLSRIREVTQSHDVVWEYRSPENRGMYRAYKYAPDHPGVRALPLTPEGDRKPAANLVSDTFLVSVVSSNNPPTVARAIADATIVSESGTHEASLTGVFDDGDGDALKVTATSSDENVAKVSVSADYSNLTVVALARGTATVTVSSNDGYGGSVEDSFAVTVKSAPIVASAIADVSDLIVGDRRDVAMSGVFSDPDGDTLAITAASSDENVVTVSVPADQSKLTVTGVAEGTATITVTAQDTDGNSVGDAFEVSVVGAEPPEGPEPWNIRVVPGDGALTVTWKVGSRAGVDDSEIWHVLRWSQEFGVWANPRDPRAVGKNDGLSVDPGLTSYTITDLKNGVATGVFIRSMVGHRNNMSERDGNSSEWVRVKGEHTTPVAPPNEAPTVSAAIADATIVSESGTKEVSLAGVFSDADGDELTITATSSDDAVATVSVSADYSTLTVTAQSRGTATITVNASDGNGGTVDDSFAVTVKAAPVVASAIADIGGLEAGDSRAVSLSGVFSDADRDALTITASSSDETKATVSVASDQSALTVSAVSEGSATITVTAQDSDGNTVSDAFDVTVTAPPNKAPTVSSVIPDATIVNESGTHRASLSGVFDDSDGDDLTVTAASSAESVATVSVAADYSTLTVSAKSRGTVTVTVTASDGRDGTASDSFTVTVKAAPMVASAIADVSELEIDATHQVSMSGVFSDADGDAVTVTQASSSDIAVAAVSAAIDGSTSAITAITVTGVSEGTATITVTAQDADGNTVQNAFDVTVNAPAAQQQVNNAPTVSAAIADATIVNKTGMHRVTLSGVFSDADGDALTVTAASSAESVATVAVSSDYSTLTVSAKSRGTATVTATATDGYGGTVEDAFIVTVKAAPVVASAIADVSGLEAESTRDISLAGVFSDADGDSLTITASSSDNAKATVAVAADQSALTVTGVAEGTAIITVTAQDTDGNTVSDVFNVTVIRAPEPEPDPVELPGPVVNLQLTATDNGIIVSWQAPESGDAPRRYIVHVRPEGGAEGSGRTKTPKAKKTKVTFDKLEAGRTYEVWVRAQNEAGKGERVKASVTLPSVLPGPVTGLEVAATEDGVTVSWNAPETGGAPDGYIVHIRPEGGAEGSGRTKTPRAKKTKVTFENMEAGRTYNVWVRAENEAGKGERVHAGITIPAAQ